mmetsp:Transcript_14117/g.27871  ORF Transcript_14117/g.27871 Transcript_14117/m.27871 type:complete len:262 (-) Transcript_14117:922-1707(-)
MTGVIRCLPPCCSPPSSSSSSQRLKQIGEASITLSSDKSSSSSAHLQYSTHSQSALSSPLHPPALECRTSIPLFTHSASEVQLQYHRVSRSSSFPRTNPTPGNVNLLVSRDAYFLPPPPGSASLPRRSFGKAKVTHTVELSPSRCNWGGSPSQPKDFLINPLSCCLATSSSLIAQNSFSELGLEAGENPPPSSATNSSSISSSSSSISSSCDFSLLPTRPSNASILAVSSANSFITLLFSGRGLRRSLRTAPLVMSLHMRE